MLRPALIPAKGKHLVVADWSSIEARATPWLSNCPAGERKLAIFANGEDVYKVNASATFGVAVDAVDDRQRQIGKVQELACGFAAYDREVLAAVGVAENESLLGYIHIGTRTKAPGEHERPDPAALLTEAPP